MFKQSVAEKQFHFSGVKINKGNNHAAFISAKINRDGQEQNYKWNNLLGSS